MEENTIKVNQPQLSPVNQFPQPAVSESVIKKPPVNVGGNFEGGLFTIAIATAADQITQWGKNVKRRDQQLRDFWPTESYLAGAVTSVSFRNATSDWQIKHPSTAVVIAVTNMLHSAIAGDTFGWNPFVNRFSQDLYTQDNGAFIELIRDPGMDANSKFKGAMAPVIGIANLDSGACQRTGNIEYPVIYTDREGEQHKLAWFDVIPFSEYPSAIERMNGVGYSAVTRALRLAQIIRSVLIFKDEEVSGTNVKKINIVGGVGRTQIDDAVKRTLENAANKGSARYVEHAVLASLDPEKPVSVATVDLAGLPQDFNFDQEMQWYISGLALDFGVDYQEFAPLPGGNIGSGAQSNMLARKASGKGPRNWMDSLTNAFTYYGVIPRGAEMIFNDKNEEEEMEKQTVRTKALEEAAIAVNSKIMTPEAAMRSLVRRGIYAEDDLKNIPPEWWQYSMDTAKNESKKQMVGDRGGNTLAEDAGRTDSGNQKPNGSDRLRKGYGDIIIDTTGKTSEAVLKVGEEQNDLMQKGISAMVKQIQTLSNENTRTLMETILQAVKEIGMQFMKKETPAPIVQVNVEPTPIKFEPVIQVAAPIMPRIKKQRQTINRGESGDIESTDTTFEYKE